MLPRVEHRYVAEILRARAETVTTPLDLDWIPAIEWGHFQRIRDNATAPSMMLGHAHICPGWDRVAGAPYVSHVDVRFGPPATGKETIPLQYFADAVEHAVGALIEAGTMNVGDTYRWRICAYQAAQAARANAANAPFQVEESEVPVPEARLLSRLLARAQYHGPRSTESERPDVPVLFAPHVLSEAAAAATEAGVLEAGGILLGKLARDSGSGDLSIEITAQIPAREAIADDASLRFTADTWRAVHAAISLRREGERILGWWHSHPAALWPCRNCPPERRPVCAVNRAFFSSMDVAFHRTAFQGAHNIALLLSFHNDPAPRFDLFGWWRGMVSARGYYLTEYITEAGS